MKKPSDLRICSKPVALIAARRTARDACTVDHSWRFCPAIESQKTKKEISLRRKILALVVKKPLAKKTIFHLTNNPRAFRAATRMGRKCGQKKSGKAAGFNLARELRLRRDSSQIGLSVTP